VNVKLEKFLEAGGAGNARRRPAGRKEGDGRAGVWTVVKVVLCFVGINTRGLIYKSIAPGVVF
jgi:hypothetical protein